MFPMIEDKTSGLEYFDESLSYRISKNSSSTEEFKTNTGWDTKEFFDNLIRHNTDIIRR